MLQVIYTNILSLILNSGITSIIYIPIICLLDTNVAVDNILCGLYDIGVKNVLRIGKPVKIREELRDLSLEAEIEVINDLIR